MLPLLMRSCHVFITLVAALSLPYPVHADTCTILYDVDATFSVSNTDFGKGNTTAPGLHGSLVLEFTRDPTGQVNDGPVHVLHYSTYVDFVDESIVTVTTKVHYFTPACNGVADPAWRLPTDAGFPASCDYRGNGKPVASGTYDKSKATIQWAACNTAKSYWASSRKSYTLSSKSNGEGCLNGLRAVGNVNCDGATTCRLGDLKPGDNPQSSTWNQPLIHGPSGSDNTVSVSRDLSTIATPLTKLDGGQLSYEIPNDAPSRTWLSWKATKNSASKFTTCGDRKTE